MTTSSEDVLAHIGHVKVKKNDGDLYLMTERIAWMPNGKDTFTISHKYCDIKTQKISPETKAKIQLQIVLHSNNTTGNNESTIFQFVNPEGPAAQLNDRNQVKELLQQLLPRFQRKLSKEMEEKKCILEQNPELYELYKELVKSNVISPEDFWSNYAKKYKGLQNSKFDSRQQNVGVSPAFLSDIKPEVDGCNSLKYNITKDIIDSIFRTYPAVKRKHYENVPHKLSEHEFWQKFFQSHYFHRDRSNSHSTKDLFSDCAKNDELDIKRALNKGIPDPFFDISSFDDYFVDGINNKDDPNSSNKTDSFSSEASRALIKRFNHHSMMVLDACLRSQEQQNSNSNSNHLPIINGVLNNNKKSKPQSESEPSPSQNNTSSKSALIHDDPSPYDELEQERQKNKRLRLMEKTEFEDLQSSSDMNCSLNKVVPLKIIDRNAYLTGPQPNLDCDNFLSDNNGFHDGNYLLQMLYQHDSLMQQWTPQCRDSLTSPAAIFAFGELIPGGALMTPYKNSNLKEEVSSSVQKELKSLTLALNELLKHFWSCFPVTTPQLGDKLKHMMTTLNEFLYKKLEPFREKLQREHYNTDLTAHLFHQLEKANNRFNTWNYRQSLNSSNGKK